MEVLAALLLSWVGIAVAAESTLSFTPQERAAILSHGPWPGQLRPDASNRVSARPAAAAFGEQLFFEPRLSGHRQHRLCKLPPACLRLGGTQGAGCRHRANAPQHLSVVNSGFGRWFGWSGATDSLWAASLRPLLDPLEMGNAERHAVAMVRSDARLSCGYRAVFGTAATDEETAFANIGKALAAFQQTLVSGRTPFDDFRDALARNDRAAASRYPADARRLRFPGH